jgi:hypothetical protein
MALVTAIKFVGFEDGRGRLPQILEGQAYTDLSLKAAEIRGDVVVLVKLPLVVEGTERPRASGSREQDGVSAGAMMPQQCDGLGLQPVGHDRNVNHLLRLAPLPGNGTPVPIDLRILVVSQRR